MTGRSQCVAASSGHMARKRSSRHRSRATSSSSRRSTVCHCRCSRCAQAAIQSVAGMVCMCLVYCIFVQHSSKEIRNACDRGNRRNAEVRRPGTTGTATVRQPGELTPVSIPWPRAWSQRSPVLEWPDELAHTASACLGPHWLLYTSQRSHAGPRRCPSRHDLCSGCRLLRRKKQDTALAGQGAG